LEDGSGCGGSTEEFFIFFWEGPRGVDKEVVAGHSSINEFFFSENNLR
jgi:hypothetical protein